MNEDRRYSFADAEQIGNAIGIDWDQFGVEQFRMGLSQELDHNAGDPQPNLTHAEAMATGKIALAHLREFSDYYSSVARMEKEADDYWADV
jgi:hypothetical protein